MMDFAKIADSLPTREDVLNAIGAATRRSATTDVSSISSMLGVFGAGILIGAGLALLFAPKTGSELRGDIENRVSDLRQNFAQRPDRSPSTGSFAGTQGAAV